MWEPRADYENYQEGWNHMPRRRHSFSRLGHNNHKYHPSPSFRRTDGLDCDNDNNSDPDGDDSEGNPKTLRRVFERFAERTSMQGIPYVYVSHALYARVLWSIIFIVGCGAMSAHLYLLISEYYEYNTQTQVQLGFSPLRFPAVTVCNVNRIRKSKQDLMSEELKALISEIQPSKIVASMENYRNLKDGQPTDGGVPSEPNLPLEPTNPDDPAEDEDTPKESNSQPERSDSQTQPSPQTELQTSMSDSVPAQPSSATPNSKDGAASVQPATTSTTSNGVTTTLKPPNTSLDTTSKPQFLSTISAGSSQSSGNSATSSPQSSSGSFTTAGVPTPQSNVNTVQDSAAGKVTSTTPPNTSPESRSGPSQGPPSGSGSQPATTKPQLSTSSGLGSGPSSNPQSPSSGSEPDSGDGSNQKPSAPEGAPGRKKRWSSLEEALDRRPLRRVKRFITGFDVNETSGRYQPNDATKNLNVYTGNKTVIRKIENELEYLYSIQERSNRMAMGHQIEDMLISCSFAGYECYAEDFELFQTAEYGNCYTIENTQFVSVDGGPSDGLELILYLDQSDYMKGTITSKPGIQVLVHEPGTWPLPHRKGFAVPAAMETFVGLRQVNLQRESQPYGDCQTDDPDLNAASIKYTRSACQLLCQQRSIHAECGCFDATMEELNRRTGDDDRFHFCLNDTEIECLTSVESQFLSGTLNCTCGNPCTETDYTKTQSFRGWPSTDYAAILAETLCNWNASACETFQAEDVNTLSQSFVKLVIFFEDLNYEDIIETPDYAETQFISDVGGTIGLWIGLSVISMFEVLQFFYEVFHYLLYDKPKQQRKAQKRAKTQRQRKTEQDTARSDPMTMTSTLSVGYPVPDGSLRHLSAMDSARNSYMAKI